jgi:ribosomal protein S18 acetylase RimI-like enzyme
MRRNAPTIAVTVERLAATDVVAMAQCVALDVGAFPHPSARFEVRAAGSPVWIARGIGESRVLGFVAARARRGELYVDGLAVDAHARGRGVGRTLVRRAIQFAKETRAHSVSLHVWTGNQVAVDLYRSEGFDIHQRVPRFYPPGSFASPDAYRMARAID